MVGDTEFEGRPATEVFISDPDGTPDANEYYQIDFETPSVNFIADINLQGTDDTARSNPGDLLRFDLEPGESYEHSSTYSSSEDGSDTYTARITYVGRETISVPAGTFETCHFETEDLASGYQLTQWYGVDNGIEIAEESSDPGEPVVREELLFAEINGQPIE